MKVECLTGFQKVDQAASGQEKVTLNILTLPLSHSRPPLVPRLLADQQPAKIYSAFMQFAAYTRSKTGQKIKPFLQETCK